LPRLLTAWPESLAARARRDLEKRGVEVRTGTFVTHVDENGVRAGDADIGARTVLWGAGVAGSPLGRALGAAVDKSGRAPVTPFLSLAEHPEVFVAGDLATLESGGKRVPGLAGAAVQEGRHAARNVLRLVRRRPARPFRYRDRGAFAVIGRGSAIGVVGGRLRVSGLVGRVAWLAIHIALLVGVRNRVGVLAGWTYAFFTRRRPMWLLAGGRVEEHAPLPAAPHAPVDNRVVVR